MHTRHKLVIILVFACIGLGGMYRDDAVTPETKSQNDAVVISGVVRYPNDAKTRKRLAEAGVNDGSGVAVYVASVPKELKGETPEEAVVLECVSGKIEPEYTCVQVRQRLLITWEKGKFRPVLAHTNHNTHLKLPPAGLWDRTKYSATFYKPEEGVILCALSSPPETAYVTVVPNQFHAVTQKDGTFRLPRGLPPWKYTVKAFHPKLGSEVKEIRFEGGQSGFNVEFNLGTGKWKDKLPLNPYDHLRDDEEQPPSEERLEKLPREQP